MSKEKACSSCRDKIESKTAVARTTGRARKQRPQEIAQWLVDPVILTQEFNAIAEEWEKSSAYQNCCVNPRFEPCTDSRFIERELESYRLNCHW
jgi:hypothetical protein